MIQTWLTKTFSLKYPVIMAPMFLVSNDKMLVAAAQAGIMGCIPALNYRTPEDFEAGLQKLKQSVPGAFGVNLIVNKSNVHLEKQIAACEKTPPAFIITSLGSPQKVIERLRPHGVKVFCDVTDLEYALKVEKLGADALIAVNSGAGGHAGPMPASILVPMLKSKCSIPVISAGGVATGAGLLSMMALGAEGISMGSPFIATTESGVTQEYKQAVVDYGAQDIALTTKISGTPCTVIKTDYVKKIGLEQNPIESFLNKNRTLKKYAKMLTYYKGMKLLEKAAFQANYKTVWCAGPSIEFVHQVSSTEHIVSQLMEEYQSALDALNSRHQ